MMMSPVQKLKRCCVTLIIALVLVNNVTLSLASTSNSEPQQSQVNGKDVPPALNEDSDETTASDDILGIGKTIFIVICVVGGLVILGILLAICFCCACLCFAGRRKSSNRQPTQVAVQSNYSGAYPQHQQSQNYGGNGGANYNYSKNDHHYEDNVGAAPYGNNNYNQHSVQHNQQPGYVHQQHQQQQHHNVQNVAYQKSASPPRDPYANSIDQAGAHQGDPNLIPNRFRPNVPPKPKGVGGSAVPGWTAVTQEVKKRTQLTMSQQNHYNEGYNNDAYDGDSQYNGGMPSPSPPSHPKYGGKSTTNDNFSMY